MQSKQIGLNIIRFLSQVISYKVIKSSYAMSWKQFQINFQVFEKKSEGRRGQTLHEFLHSENCRRFSGNLSTGKNNAVFCHIGIYSAV